MTTLRDIKGFAFDLDGVLADTAKFHSQSWREVAADLRIPWNDQLEVGIKGVDRAASLKLILDSQNRWQDFTEAEREELGDWKDDIYHDLIATLTPADVLPGIKAFLDELRAAGFTMSVASASQNAPEVIDALKLGGYFVGIVDPTKVPLGKPDPGIFLEAAKLLNLPNDQVVGVEDAAAGIESINRAGQVSMGIGPAAKQNADLYFEQIADVSLQAVREKMGEA